MCTGLNNKIQNKARYMSGRMWVIEKVIFRGQTKKNSSNLKLTRLARSAAKMVLKGGEAM